MHQRSQQGVEATANTANSTIGSGVASEFPCEPSTDFAVSTFSHLLTTRQTR